jgi:hypothetical protein
MQSIHRTHQLAAPRFQRLMRRMSSTSLECARQDALQQLARAIALAPREAAGVALASLSRQGLNVPTAEMSTGAAPASTVLSRVLAAAGSLSAARCGQDAGPESGPSDRPPSPSA